LNIEKEINQAVREGQIAASTLTELHDLLRNIKEIYDP